MNSKVPRLINGGTPGLTILAYVYIGMTGGAYYLYKQKGADSNPNVIIEANPDSTVETKANTLVETAKKDLPAETDTKLQDIVKSKMPGFSQDDQKDLTKPTTTKDSSEN